MTKLEFIDHPMYIHAPKFYVNKIYSDSFMEQKSNTFFTHEGIKIFNNDVDVMDSDGTLLIRFRKNVLSSEETEVLFDNMKSAAPKIGGRAEASGIQGDPYKSQISKNGKVLRLLKTKVRSGITGYYDNKSMFGTKNKEPCRETAFTGKNMTKFSNCLPVFQTIDSLHHIYCPEHHNLQKMASEGIDKNYIISQTCYTTVTVNKNFRTALHKDKGDFKDGIGVITAIHQGESKGGYTMTPQYGIGVDCKSGDLLFIDVHQWHCNSEIVGDGIRLSFVLYLRDKMRSVCPNLS